MTKVTLNDVYVLVFCVGVLVSAVLWLAAVDNKATAAQDGVRELKPLIIDIRERVIRMEGKLK